MLSYFFFFFQAEDGIRDLVRSRGLGDVYKRQTFASMEYAHKGRSTRREKFLNEMQAIVPWDNLLAVSYTHLTLPTSDLV